MKKIIKIGSLITFGLSFIFVLSACDIPSIDTTTETNKPTTTDVIPESSVVTPETTDVTPELTEVTPTTTVETPSTTTNEVPTTTVETPSTTTNEVPTTVETPSTTTNEVPTTIDEPTETYKVYFYDDDGLCKGTKIVKYGEKVEPLEITKPTDSKYIYTFRYWQANPYGEGSVEFDFENTPITHDIAVYAIWSTERVKYQVTFDTKGGSEIESQMVAWDNLIFYPTTDPTKYGYTFAGWYYGDTKYDFSTKMPCNDVTLTAKWEAVDVTVKYILRNYNGNVREEDSRTVKFNDQFEDIRYELYGFDQTYWYNENGKIYNDTNRIDELSMTVYSDVLSEGLSFKKYDDYYAASYYNGTDGNVYIPYYYYGLPVKKLLTGTFYNNENITWAYLPDSIIEIEEKCFFGCKKLEKVRFSQSLHKLPSYAFAYSGITDLNVNFITEIGDHCFYNCERFAGIKDYDSIEKYAARVLFKDIPTSAFEGCKSLKLFDFENVNHVGKRAFANCEILSELINYDSLWEIGDYAFDSCNIESFECPDDLYTIGESAFGNNYNLTNFVIGVHVIYTGARMVTNSKIKFVEENNLKYIPSNNNDYYLLYDGADVATPSINSNCSLIGSSAFEHFENIKSVVIPAEVKGIGARAFYGCVNITSIDIHQFGVLKVIGDYAFTGTNITTLNIPDTIQFIGCGILNSCKNIESVSCLRTSMWCFSINNELDPIDWEAVYGFLSLNKYTYRLYIEEDYEKFFSYLTNQNTRFFFNARTIYEGQ